jgi:hypothetical protein
MSSKLADVRHEVSDRAVGSEKTEDIGANDDAAYQQSHGWRNMHPTAQSRDGNDQDQPKREFCEGRQGQEVGSDKVENVGPHCSS